MGSIDKAWEHIWFQIRKIKLKTKKIEIKINYDTIGRDFTVQRGREHPRIYWEYEIKQLAMKYAHGFFFQRILYILVCW